MTGASGFVGVNLVRALVAAGHDVVAIDRVRRGPDADTVTWSEVDILDAAAMAPVFDGAEVVYHLAAVIALSKRQEQAAFAVNVTGARAVAEAARVAGVRRLVQCSSLAAFDPRQGGVPDERRPRSLAPELPAYHRTKALGELEVLAEVERGLDAVICNPTGIFGPEDYGPSRLNNMLLSAARGRLPVGVRSDFDMVDVRDIALGLIAAGEHGRSGENYLLSGHTTDFVHVLSLAARLCGRRPPLMSFPVGVLSGVTRVLEPVGDLLGRDELSRGATEALRLPPVVDGSKARRELGYAPRPTDDTVRDLIVHFIDTDRLRPRAKNLLAADRVL
ncbi:NAD-dependent epimerase/dehydratase family protein [Nocardia bovistercoris]|uniref:NAD-dependent epimerase/dehydratase family protein n=1 Tax=Nocardia bovistercoris TaxID=2785916 RepID=UPI002FCD5295